MSFSFILECMRPPRQLQPVGIDVELEAAILGFAERFAQTGGGFGVFYQHFVLGTRPHA